MSVTTVAIVPRAAMIVLKKFLTINVMEEVLTALLVVIKWSFKRGGSSRFIETLTLKSFKIYVTLYIISYIKILLQEIYKVSRLIELRGVQALNQFRGVKRVLFV